MLRSGICLQHCVPAEILPLFWASNLSSCAWAYHGVEDRRERRDGAEKWRHCLRS